MDEHFGRLTTRDLCVIFKCTRMTIYLWRTKYNLPFYEQEDVFENKRVLFRLHEVAEWVERTPDIKKDFKPRRLFPRLSKARVDRIVKELSDA